MFVISSSCSVWNYKIPTRAANFVDSPNASSRSVMFSITSPKNECTLASQLMEGLKVKILGTLDPKTDIITVRTIEPGSPSASKRSPPK